MVKETTIATKKLLQNLKENNQIVFTYAGENPNGSLEDIAGIVNEKGNVLGMMPHPERAVNDINRWRRWTSVIQINCETVEGNIMSIMLEPTAEQIKEQKLYAQMGMSDEEFEMVEKILGRLTKLYRNRSILCYVV